MTNEEKRNIYNNIQNLYNMDFTTWQEVLAMLYNLVADVEQKFEAFEQKFELMLGKEVTEAIKKMYEDGTLAEIIDKEIFADLNNKIDEIEADILMTLTDYMEENNKKIETFNEQLDNIENKKTDKSTTENLQTQVNSLVLGAVGDGNNAEVVQAKVDKNGSTFSTLKDNLDNIKNSIETGIEKYRFGSWEQGSISSNGTNNDDVLVKNIRIRTKNILFPSIIPLYYEVFIVNILSEYSADFTFYTDNTFSTLLYNTGWVTGKYNVPKKSDYLRIVIKKNDGSNINANEGSGVIYVEYNSKNYIVNDNIKSDRTTYSSNKLYSTMIDIYGTSSTTEKEEDRHIIRIKDLENSFNLKDTTITDDGVLTSTIIDTSNWSGIYTRKDKIKIEFAINNNGWVLYSKNDKTYYMIPLLGSKKGYKYTITEGTLNVTVSDSSIVTVGDLWNTANNNTVFTLEKIGNTLNIYMGEGVGSTLIATLNDCNILGFLSSSTFNTTLTNCYATTQIDKVLTKGLYQKVYDLEEKLQTGSSTTLDDRFKDMNALCTGDSITEKNFRATLNWVDYIKNWCGFKSCTNDGKSGTGLVRPNAGYKCLIDRIDDWNTNYDLILLMGNMNDYSDPSYFTETKLGVMGDKTKDTQYGAIDVTINKLLSKYPNASIGWIISTPRQYQSKYGASETVAKDGYLWGNTSAFENGCQAIKEVCNKYSIPVLDLYHESGLRPWNDINRAKYFSCTQAPDGDGVHPNDLGQKLMAYKIYEFVKQYM